MVSGLTVVLGTAWFQRGGQTPSVGQDARFTPLALPGAEAVAEVPVIGALYSELLSAHNLLVYLATAAVPLTWWLVYRTRFGSRLRPGGENTGALAPAAIPVPWPPYRAVLPPGVPWRLART